MKSGFAHLKDNLVRNRILVENFTFLSVLQVTNLILFLITIPYLFRVLGSKFYGVTVFAQAIVFYFTVLINFGFNLTATRDISVNRSHPYKIREIISSVLTIKLLLFVLSALIMVTLTFLIPEFKLHRSLFLLSMLAGLSEALFPIWYFQGIEKMKYITFINITTRILATLLIFLVIDRESDYYLYPLLLGIGTISGSIAALMIILFKYKIRFILLPLNILFRYLKENTLYFLSNVSTQIYVNANKIIVGTFLGMVEVAYYDVAERIINIVKVPYSLVGQTLFPKVAKEKNILFLRWVMLATFFFTVLIITAIYFFSQELLILFSRVAMINSVNTLRILSLSLLPISISLFYGDLLLVSLNLKLQYTLMRFLGLVVYLLLFLLLVVTDELGMEQVAFIVVFVETFMALYSYLLIKKQTDDFKFGSKEQQLYQ